jgi:hypothetical protein
MVSIFRWLRVYPVCARIGQRINRVSSDREGFMARQAISLLAFVFALCTARVGTAHHPPQMDHCASFSFAGQIERIEWHAPHVELYIRTAEGDSHHVSWLAINRLGLAGIDRDTLRIDDQVEVTVGIRIDDSSSRPMLLSYIHRESDGWGWSETPQGC